MKLFGAIAGLGLAFVSMVNGQGDKVQTSVDFCNWYRFRAGVIRDTVYLDGGSLLWQRNFQDGRPILEKAGPDLDNMFTLLFNSSFDMKTNFTDLLGRIPRLAGGDASSFAPTYVDGTMFYSDYTLLTYGGTTRRPLGTPTNSSLYGYNAYQYGPFKPPFKPGSILPQIREDVTRYITHGAGVSVPSENKGYYFSGRQRENGDVIDLATQPNITANTLISVDLSKFDEPKFARDNLTGVTGRLSAELVWLPISDGIMVVIGGVTNPESIYPSPLSPQEKEENTKKDSAFMETVSLYDIGTGEWYSQKTTGDIPPTSNSFCSVVGEAADRSSFNIYIYGGYNGTERTVRPYDDVHVLSIPSFTWTKVYTGESNMGRRAHKCVKPYPDQMFVIGGQYTSQTSCLVGPLVRVFNLNELKFKDKYDPREWSEYLVPDVITKKIGGTGKGGATKTQPDSWDNDKLGEIFGKKYTKTIQKWYPYEPAQATSSAPGTTAPAGEDKGGGGGLPRWVGAVLGVVLGLIFITALAVVWLIFRRRKERRYAPSLGGTSEVARRRILGWMYGMGQPSHKPDMTTTSTEIGINDKHASTGIYSDSGIDSVVSPNNHPPSTIVYSDINAPEAGSSPIHEMHAGTVMSPSELPTPFNDTPVTARHPSETPSFISPISPASSPSPENQRELHHPVRPTHGRHGSSFSSIGVPVTLDNVVVSENTESRSRERRVSGFTEEFADTHSPSYEDVETGHKI
ncbi:hypothetical protein TESG_07223 [Trichophyton tonsurans CBS 112818]|uniref:Kelch repeat protein n=1 Tax=Trichophyton tonsurans (strain CBS 112818) TaxID=647933 RepID=F2S8J1_TRIT1|nr:hypothetical protein TESG_07223 [Trichophyton tonsurans CBS 112818]